MNGMKPILFNTEMVRAILEGRKTATRRVVKPQPSMPDLSFAENRDDIDAEKLENYKAKISQNITDRLNKEAVSPYHPGDILYVWETWRVFEAGYPPYHSVIEYKAGGKERFDKIISLPTVKGEWKSPIHMHKEAARLFLRVTGVRVERLQEISVEDAVVEGCITPKQTLYVNHKGYFSDLWDSTIKPADLPRYGWEANPWVWVIEFERISKTEGGQGSD